MRAKLSQPLSLRIGNPRSSEIASAYNQLRARPPPAAAELPPRSSRRTKSTSGRRLTAKACSSYHSWSAANITYRKWKSRSWSATTPRCCTMSQLWMLLSAVDVSCLGAWLQGKTRFRKVEAMGFMIREANRGSRQYISLLTPTAMWLGSIHSLRKDSHS